MFYKYQPHITPGPNGTTLFFSPEENSQMVEVAVVDGWRYVFVPEGVHPPEQPVEIQWQPANLDAAALERLKEASPLYQMIGAEIQNRIRGRYSPEREAAFARLGASVALGMHELTDEERQEFLAYDNYVEEVRQWGRAERAAIGL